MEVVFDGALAEGAAGRDALLCAVARGREVWVRESFG